MPSDFTSLFSADIDLDSPKSLYSKESVYDLLPRELQLPSSREENAAAMSQKSGGETGPPPTTAIATDASSAMTTGSPRSPFPTSSSSSSHSTPASERATAHESGTPGDAGGRRKAEESKLSGGARVCGEKGAGTNQQQHQMTPSKRPVLNISPPPEDLFDDSQMSCQDELQHDSEQSNSIWMEKSASNFSIVSSSSYNDNTEVPRKARKCTPRQKPGPKPASAEEASMDVFDADSAKGPHFVLSQLGPDSKACSKASSEGPQASGHKGGILSCQYPQKSEGKELKILVQPETQHRARYLTEGSRGSVKDRTQQGFPTINLDGVKEPVVLLIFVGNDAGRVKPHGFYQACRVTGRNTTTCREVDIEGTTVIEVPLNPSSNMTLAVDCVGILKLRNADVEARIGVAGSKKKSTRARLIFRVNIPRPDGSVLTLQASSSPILCTQPAGVPEILKKSLHSCSVKGESEVFIIGKNFLKGTKVIFQENASDDKSWKAEADIDMDFFHQNHLIVKVPPYQNQAITSPVSVCIYVVTNAGRSHDLQPFTYTPEPVVDSSVKKEVLPPVTPCCFEQIKVIDSALMTPVLSLVKQEEATPMEVSSNPSAFKQTSNVINSAQQALDMSTEISANSCTFSSPLTHQTREQEQSQNSGFSNKEAFSTIQEQDLAPSGSFHMPSKSLLQQGVQPFLLEHRDGLGQERSSNTGGSMVGLSPIDENPQQQLSLLPPDEVAQLEQAVRQLQAKGFCNIQLQTENSLSKQRQHHLQQQQQQQIQLQQQIHQQEQQIQLQQQIQQQEQQIQLQQQIQQQEQQIQLQQQIQQQEQQIQLQQQIQQQEQQIHLQQQIQQQQQQIQQQEQQIKLQQQQVLENLQHHLFQPPVQLHCSSEQQGSSQVMVQNGSPLFQQTPPPQQQQQQAALFQQAKELISIQTGFLQQQPNHSSQSLFHTSTAMTEAQSPQEALFHTQKTSPNQDQVQASLFQSNVTVLSGSNMATDAQPSATSMFLSQNAVPGQLAVNTSQPQQLAFLTSSLEAPSVFQTPTQLSPIQQSTPMEQQQSPQQAQPGSIFQSISQSPSKLSSGQQQPPGLLLSSLTSTVTQEQTSGLLFGGQNNSSLSSPEQQNSSLPFSIRQQEPSEPMTYRDQSAMVVNPSSNKPMFQDQQPMQLASSSGSDPSQSLNLYMAQPNMPAGVAPQETLFAPQSDITCIQTSTSSPVQQPGPIFQTTMSGGLNQPNQNQQPNLFLFEIQNECHQLMNSQGTTLSDQIIGINQSGPTQQGREVQSLLGQSMSDTGSVHTPMTTSQNMEKIDDLLVSLQEQGNNISHSY
ncbi:nuclear factor of activated T-cells 5 isoform X1 [Triplophysa rosa]|uniref:Nuclear factor of activated T-cells 5 n=2 Tax=Triplophysa rosa TaxID=992332 RepID=A0A9W8CBD7_TRIRA|nr:nuclear factor of activated T-cells 5 isoform X1 [Triplophysa rosa]KAI7813940.1 putative nuclear factor of activated T-cells 5-like [Triplophysa rosa]